MRKKVYPATMLEVILALAIFAALSASFLTLINSLDKANTKTWKENAAIAVLDNCLERLSATPKPDITRIKCILQDEFKSSPLGSANLTPPQATKTDEQHVELVIFDKHKKKIVGIKIKCEN